MKGFYIYICGYIRVSSSFSIKIDYWFRVSSFGDIYINLIKLFFGGFGGRILEGFHRRQMTQRVKNRLAVFSIKIKSAFDVHRNVSLLKKEKN